MSQSIETSYGPVDRKALEKLRNSFDTTRLFDAVDAVDRVRYRIDEVRQDLLDVHSMAMRIPAKVNADSEGNVNGIPGRRRTGFGA